MMFEIYVRQGRLHFKKIMAAQLVLCLMTSFYQLPIAQAQTNAAVFSLAEDTSDKYDYDAQLEFVGPGKVQLANIQTNWYGESWQYRQKLVIDKSKVQGEHNNFPVLVHITNQNNHLFGNAQSDGDDILFTSDNGTTKLDYELESYAGSGDSKALIAWVEVPTITDVQDTTLYLYYGNESAASQESISSTWENSFAAVWHLNEAGANGSSGAFDDSTDRGSNGTATNFDSSSTSTTDTQAKFGKGVVMDGINDYIVVPFAGNMAPANQVTLSMWVKPTAASYGMPVAMNSFITYGVIYSGTNFQPAIRTAGGFVNPNPSATFNPDSWYHVTVTYDGSSVKLYVDGNLVHQQAASGVLSYNGTTAVFGSYLGSCCFYKGYLDEVRLTYNVTRSPSYIATEYANQSSPNTFFKTSDDSNFVAEQVPTLTLKKEHGISYASLSSFKEVATKNGGQIRYQLSNNGGDTWYWWHGGFNAWMKETDLGFNEANEAETINDHISTFPIQEGTGTGKLLWRAFLKSDGHQLVQLDEIIIGYVRGTTSTSKTSSVKKKIPVMTLAHPLMLSLNSQFKLAYGRMPTFGEWKYWANRIIKREKTSVPALLGAMRWHSLNRR